MMRTAISPRLAMRSFWIVMDGLNASNVNLCDRLTGHHRILVLGKEANDLAGCARLHLVERLYHLDQADRVVFRDRVTIGFVDWLVRCWLAVEYAWEGRKDLLYGHEFLLTLIASALVASNLACRVSARCEIRADCLANGLGDGGGIRRVGVDANRIRPDRDVVSSHCARLAFDQGSQAPCCCVGWILGLMFARDDEASLGIVVEIGIVLGDKGVTAAPINLLVQRPFHAEQRHLVDIGRVSYRLGDVLHPCSHAVECAVWLDMIE